MPALTWDIDEVMMSTDIGTRPPMTSCSAAAAPLYGTCVIVTFAIDSIRAAPTWLVDPVPDVAMPGR